jgi:hypothetical protein
MNKVRNGNFTQVMWWDNMHPRYSTINITIYSISFAQKCELVLYIGGLRATLPMIL